MEVGVDQRDAKGVGGPTQGAALLERDGELEALRAFIQDADESSPRLALVEGPAGIGKTVLLGEARSLGEGDGMQVLAARGSQLEREFPFGVVRQLFEPLLVDPKRRKGLLAGAAAPAATIFDSVAEDGADGADTSFAALHGLYWLTVNLADERPLLLVIDDLHWVDHPSLRFIAYLVRRLEGLGVSIVAATRPNEPGADAALLGEIAGDALTTIIRPGALGEAGVRELIKARIGREPDEGFARACHTATGGNPLFMSELIKAMQVENTEPVAANTAAISELGPRAMSRAVLLRLSRVSEAARAVVQAAAVLDEGFDVGLLAALTGLPEAEVASATGELARAEILRPEQPLGFVHPLIRAVVYQDMAPGERELDHARAARLLADADAPGERIASHLLAVPARGDAWVAETLRNAAREAMKKGAADSAVEYMRRAHEEPPAESERARVTLELGLVESLTNAPAAVGHLRSAYGGLDDPLALGLTANVLARVLLWNDAEAAAEVARRTAERMPEGLDDLKLSLQAFEAATLAFGVDASEAIARLSGYRDPAALTRLGQKMMGAVASWHWAHQIGPRDACVELAWRALEGAELIRADHGLLPMFAIATLISADDDRLMDAWEMMLREAHSSGSMFGITTIQMWRGYTLLLRGDLEQAERSLQDAVISFPRYGYGESGMVYTQAHLARILLERGDLSAARRVLDESSDPGYVDAARYWLNAQMAVTLVEGRHQEVIELADQVPDRAPWALNTFDNNWRSFKATALYHLDRYDEAMELLHGELELARKWGAPAAVGEVLRVIGALEREDGIENLTEAVELLGQSTHRLEEAKALCSLGTALRLKRKPTEAREPLRKSLELATACSATSLVERARTELHATGARPRSTALSGVESLTPSERRVADLAADGLSNREIAQELYVTPKTVEVHLSNTYRKLEIRSRRELSGALAPA